MGTVKLFLWFAGHSWSYMQGDRRVMLRGFVRAWCRFNALAKADAAREVRS